MGFAFLCLRLFFSDGRAITAARYYFFLELLLIETVFAPTPSRPNIAAANVPINKLPYVFRKGQSTLKYSLVGMFYTGKPRCELVVVIWLYRYGVTMQVLLVMLVT